VRVGIPSGSVGQRIVRFDIVVFDSNRVAAPLSRAAEGITVANGVAYRSK
jgi:hypothetical protein